MAQNIQQPDNLNYFIPTGFRFQIKRIPSVVYFCQSANLPGLAVSPATQSTPFKSIPIPGDTAEYNELRIRFIIDEELTNWLEIYNWIKGYSSPNSFKEYQDLIQTSTVQSDGNLMILSSHRNIQYNVTFYDLFPTDLSDIDMDTTLTDADVVTADTTFRYTTYKIERTIGK